MEKIRDQNRIIIFCLGRTGYGTKAAVEYLARSWREMWKDHKERCFARCLWFSKQKLVSAAIDWEPVFYDDVHYEYPME